MKSTLRGDRDRRRRPAGFRHLDGDTIDRVVAYDDGTAYMEPDPDITDFIRSQFAWGDRSDEAVPLQRELVTEITDDEVRLVAEL